MDAPHRHMKRNLTDVVMMRVLSRRTATYGSVTSFSCPKQRLMLNWERFNEKLFVKYLRCIDKLVIKNLSGKLVLKDFNFLTQIIFKENSTKQSLKVTSETISSIKLLPNSYLCPANREPLEFQPAMNFTNQCLLF
jgi:hypothetical protein